MPAKVDDLFEDVKKKNPSYSDEQAWGTAWSVYCKHVNPGSDSCHKPTSEYLKGKSASGSMPTRVVARFLTPLKTASFSDEYEDKATGDIWVISKERNRDFSSPFKTVWTVTNDTQREDWGEFYSEEEALEELKGHIRPGNLRAL